MKIILLVLFTLSLFIIPFASAHPFTEETYPNSSNNGPVGLTKVYVIYSEPVEINFSELKVYDSNGDQIDNRDTKYYQNEKSLIVTTPPLEEGVYTVASKVLSKVDGHLVPSAFTFGVGDIQVDTSQERKTTEQLLFFPEAGARFPGLVGQTIVLGAIIASILIWGTQNKELIKNEVKKVEQVHHGRFMSLTGIGLILVFVSNILMLAVQSFRLEVSAFDAIQTTFGTTWLIRMIITLMMLGVWFWLDRKPKNTVLNQIPFLVLALILIGTSSMIGHGAATEQLSPLILDYIHNLVAAIWIGGIIYFVFALLPTFSQLEESKKEKISLLMIPRFSIAFVIAVGVVVITGPTLMWMLESDIGLITESTYGKLIFAKIAIASVMVALGGFFQFKVQKSGESGIKSSSILVHKKLKRSLKFDAALGILLLGVVAILANGTLPAGEIQKVDAQEVSYGFKTIEFSENARFDIEISPFTTGNNAILVKATNHKGEVFDDFKDLNVKISNPQKNIVPIEITLEPIKTDNEIPNEFKGDLAFGFSGIWQVEVEVQRTENANEVILLNLLVKPHLSNLKVDVIEYDFPEDSKPLFPLYDGKGSIWISDPSSPRLWKFNLESKEFESFSFDGVISMFLTKDSKGNIWFTDTPRNQIGYINPQTEKITTIPLPELQPILNDNVATFIQADLDDNIWIAITNKDIILKYDSETNVFEKIKLKDVESLPFALALGPEGNIWFTETGKGRIGYINPQTNEVKEFEPNEPLKAPEYLLFDNKGNVWIAEHTGTAITKFNPLFETFETIKVIDNEALPYGMSFGPYGNIWIAQHTVDSIAAYDPDNNDIIEIPIPTATSFVQFTTTDSNDNVWFVEQRGNKLGTLKITELPSSAPIQLEEKIEIKYTEIASPLIAMGIIATSLFFVKNIKDKRRLNELINS